MNNPILADSSFLYAIYSITDHNHDAAKEFILRIHSHRILVPEVTLPEVAFLFIRDVGYEAVGRFLQAFARSDVELQSISLTDVARAQAIMVAYPKAKFDLVDCCIMALAERLNITQVATFDRRDYSVFRPKHCDYLELLP